MEKHHVVNASEALGDVDATHPAMKAADHSGPAFYHHDEPDRTVLPGEVDCPVEGSSRHSHIEHVIEVVVARVTLVRDGPEFKTCHPTMRPHSFSINVQTSLPPMR